MEKTIMKTSVRVSGLACVGLQGCRAYGVWWLQGLYKL